MFNWRNYILGEISLLHYIYVFHTWSFCAWRKTSTIGSFELLIIINCWIFCAYTQILSRDVEDFWVHAQKFLIMILDNKVFQHWIICAYTQILNRDVEVFCVHAQKFLIMILDNKAFQCWIICAYTQILNRDVEVFCVTYAENTHVSMRFSLIYANNPALTFKIIISSGGSRTTNAGGA